MADLPPQQPARPTGPDRATLRARDFWAGIGLAAISTFFLIRTAALPFWEPSGGGVTGAGPHASAGLVPFGIFGTLLVLALVLIGIAIREGGAARALSAAGIGWDWAEAGRLATLAVILTAYIVGLVPRSDFVIASALLIQALIYGFHEGRPVRRRIAAALVALPAIYAMVFHLPQAEWGAKDDDWVTLACFAILAALTLRPGAPKAERAGLTIALLAPLILVSAMAFGFRQNVPNRSGLVFEQLQYHWYVTLRDWREG